MEALVQAAHIHIKSQFNYFSGTNGYRRGIADTGVFVDKIFDLRDGFFARLKQIHIKELKIIVTPVVVFVSASHPHKV